MNAGIDGSDVRSDAGIDAGIDAGKDAEIDAEIDAEVDAEIDAGIDAGIDAVSDVEEEYSREDVDKEYMMKEKTVRTKRHQCTQCAYKTDRKDGFIVHLKEHIPVKSRMNVTYVTRNSEKRDVSKVTSKHVRS